MQTIDALDSTLRSYLNPEQSTQVRRAYYFAEQAHHGQIRRAFSYRHFGVDCYPNVGPVDGASI